MADDLTKKGAADRKRISVTENHELRYWSERFGVTSEQLMEAIQKVGPMVDDVARQLGKSS